MKVKIIAVIGMVIIVGVVLLVLQAGGHLPSLDPLLDAINPLKPKDKTTIDIVITDIKQVSQLVTTRYTIEQVAEKGEVKTVLGKDVGWKMIMVEKGRVEAGLDLDQLTKKNVSISEDTKTITVKLPPVMILTERDYILSSVLEDTYVYDYWKFIPINAPNEDDLEMQMRGEAGDRILEIACKDGILKDATEDAKAAIERFLKTTVPGYSVTVISAPVPSECKAK